MTDSPPSRTRSYSRELVSLVVTPSDYQSCSDYGFCNERRESDSGYCGCFKARFRQLCPACHEMILEGYCIDKGTLGWVHRNCLEDESDHHGEGHPGWCEERQQSYSGYCRCHKANFPQQCQACNEYIREGHCIIKESYGWVHCLCPGDERRGNLAIAQGLNPNVRYDAMIANEPFNDTPLTASTTCGANEPTMSAKRKLDFDGLNEDKKRKSSTLTRMNSVRSGSQNGFCTTQEQDAILAHVPTRGGSPICINALAGCGKTTTIAMLCNTLQDHHPDWKLLYIVFGKKNQEEAKNSEKFPKQNMDICTSHGFVWRKYFGAIRKPSFSIALDYSLDDIVRKCNVWQDMKNLFPEDSHASDEFRRKMSCVLSYIRRTVRSFQVSADLQVNERHVYWRAKAFTNLRNCSTWRQKVPPTKYVHWAQAFFNAVQGRCHRLKGGKLLDGGGISYDGYLKVAQLEGDMTFGYDVIIVDEAQDLTPCQAAIFWGGNTRYERIVYLFGDRYQQIFRFRGANTSFKDTCEASDTQVKFDLTGSFRFGEKIAEVATTILKVLGGKPLVGRALDPGKITIHNNNFEKGVVLTRTHCGMYSYLLQHRPRKWCFLSGKRPISKLPRFVESLEEFLKCACVSKKNKERKNDDSESNEDRDNNGDNGDICTFLYKQEVFHSIDDIHEYIDDEGDTELMKYLQLVLLLKDEQKSIKEFIRCMDDSFCPLGTASLETYKGCILGTVHWAKGLEVDRVLIHNDFKFDLINSAVSNARSMEEANFLFVAATRAKKHLYLCREASNFLEHMSKMMHCPTLDISTRPSLQDIREGWEEQWRVFSATMPEIRQLSDIPWPSLARSHNLTDNLLSLDGKMDEPTQRRYLRSLRLRYHPDKFFTRFGHLILDEPELQSTIKGSLALHLQACQEAIRDLQNQDEAS